jgi:hypothetical protein
MNLLRTTNFTRFVEDPRVLAVISRIGLRRQAFTNYEFHEICRRPTSARSNLTNWLAQTGFYEHESHESHELIIMTTNLTNWLVAQGRITGTGFWISGDRLFSKNNLSPEIQKPVPVILLLRVQK